MSKPSLINKRRQAQQGIQAAGYFGIPELKNPRYLACFKDGRRAHLKAALAGADLGAYVDERAISPGRSFILQKGQRLRFTQPFNGARAYLAAPGGFDAQAVLGSCATVVREALGGVDGFGKALAEGGRLAYSGTGGAMKVLANPDVQSAASLDVIIGAQIGQFSGQSLFDAFNSEWALDSRADRMGMRFGFVVAEPAEGGFVADAGEILSMVERLT